MIAAWDAEEQVVKRLIAANAIVDADPDSWLRQGILRLKRMSVEHYSWPYEAAYSKKESSVSIDRASPRNLINGSLVEKLWLLSSEDTEAIASVRQILSLKPSEANIQPLDDSLKDSKSTLAGSVEAISSESNPTVRVRSNARRSNKYRQGLNLDKLIGNNPDMIIDLTMELPEKGTELDSLCIQVFQCVLQLVMAANKNIKHHYVVIAAKAIHHSREIIRAIEAIDKSTASTKNAVSPISPIYCSTISNKLADGSLISNGEVRRIIRLRAKDLNNECHDELTLMTKIACGIWPPPTAVADMIRTAATLARKCRELVDLANVLGFYPLNDKPLEMQLEPFQEPSITGAESTPSAEEEDTDGDSMRPNILNYENYRRQNDLKAIEQLSKSYDKNLNKTLEAMGDPDAEFFKSLEEHLKKFVMSVTDLKKIRDQHLKDQYITATSMVHSRVDVILEEIKSFDLFDELSDTLETLMLTAEEVEALEVTGLSLDVNVFPAPIKPLLREAQEDVKLAARRITEMGKLASGVWPPPLAEREMLESCYPCVLAVKKLFSLTKEAANKIRRVWAEDVKKKEEWNRKRLQNEKVKALFQVWQGQDETAEGHGSDELTPAELIKLRLEENYDGISLETNAKVLRGGRLAKMVEYMTSHLGLDQDLMASFLLTHHSFTTSLELLNCFIRRYERFIPPPGLTEKLHKAWFNRRVKPTQHNVIAVLRYWLKTHFEEDFGMNELLLRNLRGFVARVIVLDWELLGKDMLELIDHQVQQLQSSQKKERRKSSIPLVQDESQPQSFFSKSTVPKPILPKSFQPTSTDLIVHLLTDRNNIFDIDPLELARQLTLIEFEDFKKVKPYECLAQIWASKLNKEREAARIKGGMKSNAKAHVDGSDPDSNIMKMIKHTNLISSWVATCIVSNDNLKTRIAALKYFAQCALKCWEVNNFNGITGIVAGLSMAPISRLKKTWQHFAEKHSSIYDEYEQAADIVSPKGQYASYRKELKDLKPPAIPFLGNPDFLPESHFINFEKRRKVNGVIREIQRYQVTPYNWVTVEGLRSYLLKLGDDKPVTQEGAEGEILSYWPVALLSEDELYTQSLIIEPREEDDDDE